MNRGDMKKFLTHGKNTTDDCPRQMQKTGEERKFSKHDSSEHKRHYFAHENMPMRYPKQSYEMERRLRSIQNYDYKKNGSTSERDLHEANKGARHSSSIESYKKFHNTLYPDKGNTYPDEKIPTSNDDFPRPTDTRIKFKKTFTSENDTKDECFNSQRNGNNISVNAEKPPIDNNTHFEDENSLLLFQKYSTPPYQSNQLLQYYNKQNNDQSNEYFHDLSKSNVYRLEERENCQSYKNTTYNSSQKAVFLNDSLTYEGMGFGTLTLKDLLYYNINLMQAKQLFEYASAVKYKILEKIDKFQQPERDELEFLCEITDGDQSEKNQQLITTKTCHIVKNIMEKFPLLLNTRETSQIVYKIAPNSHYATNSFCYESPVQEMVQNGSVMLFTPTKDYNLMSEYSIAQNGSCVYLQSNSFDIQGLNEEQNFNTNSAKNSNSVNSLITEEDKNITFSENTYQPAMNPEEYIPADKFSCNEEENIFAQFNLDDLLKYDINRMHGDMVFHYALSIKQKILKKIHQFNDPLKEKLEFLCELTDGTQIEQNQKLINEQICYLITCAYENESVLDNSRNFSGKQSNFGSRRT